MKLKVPVFFVSLFFLITGCTSVSPQVSTETLRPTIAFPTPVQSPTSNPNFPSGPITLIVWLPPEFDPNNGSKEADLLMERLDDFSNKRTGVKVEVRIKNLEGPGSLLESLIATKEAAPLALPDLIALPGDHMQIAASQNLIYPLERFLSGGESNDWYDFAYDLGKYQGEQYGIPFAAQAFVMAYHPIIVTDPPKSWQEILQGEDILAFPVADPDAYFTLALYQSLGGELIGENGDLQLDRNFLEQVFNFYQQANVAGVMPDWLVEDTSDDLAWGEFMKNQAQMAITWTTRFFDPSTGGINFTAIPTKDGTTFTYGSGWVWCLSGYDSSRYQTTVDLAESLADGEFLGGWTLAAGYLPPRPSSLAIWPSNPASAFVSEILPTAILVPDIGDYPGLGDVLAQATIEVLNQEITPAEAADEVLASIAD
jgi:multiple sugar transport system substrate-binding protein